MDEIKHFTISERNETIRSGSLRNIPSDPAEIRRMLGAAMIDAFRDAQKAFHQQANNSRR